LITQSHCTHLLTQFKEISQRYAEQNPLGQASAQLREKKPGVEYTNATGDNVY
jgi:hypothetical protein